jgi:DNA-binding sugar fermentation-stimulating protein
MKETKSNWKFERFLFNVSLNNHSISKYTNDSGQIKLCHEYNQTVKNSTIVDSESKYDDFLDAVLDPKKVSDNSAAKLDAVLNQLFGEGLIFDGDAI